MEVRQLSRFQRKGTCVIVHSSGLGLQNGTPSGSADTIKKASEINKYSPCEFGLYKSLVGVDTKADFVDNIILYKDQVAAETNTPEPTMPAEKTPDCTESTSSNDNVGSDDKKQTDNGIEDILIYCAIGVCVAAIIIMAVCSKKKK